MKYLNSRGNFANSFFLYLSQTKKIHNSEFQMRCKHLCIWIFGLYYIENSRVNFTTTSNRKHFTFDQPILFYFGFCLGVFRRWSFAKICLHVKNGWLDQPFFDLCNLYVHLFRDFVNGFIWNGVDRNTFRTTLQIFRSKYTCMSFNVRLILVKPF